MKDEILSTSVQKHVVNDYNVHVIKLLVTLESYERVKYYKVLCIFHLNESMSWCYICFI